MWETNDFSDKMVFSQLSLTLEWLLKKINKYFPEQEHAENDHFELLAVIEDGQPWCYLCLRGATVVLTVGPYGPRVKAISKAF